MKLYFEISHSEPGQTPAVNLFGENSPRVKSLVTFARELHRGCLQDFKCDSAQ